MLRVRRNGVIATAILMAIFLQPVAAQVVDAKPNLRPVDPQHTWRLYPGLAFYIHNPSGKSFDVDFDLRDWNMFGVGAREVLFKVYDPDGKVLARQVIADDGVTSGSYQPLVGGWDHEMWYYTLCHGRGSVPMIRWSSLSEPKRLEQLAARTFTHHVNAGKPGVYRVLVTGSRDHTLSLNISGGLRYAVAGHPLWLHGRADRLTRMYVYVPRGTVGLNLGFAEYDQPTTRRFKIATADGTVLYEGDAAGGFQRAGVIEPFKDGALDDQVLVVEVTSGTGDYMLHMQLQRTRDDLPIYRGTPGVPALYAFDEATAKAMRGGAIYHDDQVFWHGYQVRLHDWIKSQPEEAFVVRDKQGNEIKPERTGKTFGFAGHAMGYKGLATVPDFVPLNGPHEAPPICDQLMHDYPAHKQRAVLNVAIKDLTRGLRQITIGDHPGPSGWNGNMGYLFATYGFHYWRPAWRVLQQSDAPDEVKAAVREAMILCGDRLAFSRTIERANGNAFAHIPMALRYAAEATGDQLQDQLATTYLKRFATGGWGPGAGISPNGDCQEHFAHAYAYGAYILDTYQAIDQDLGRDEFRAIHRDALDFYTYVVCPEVNGAPWSSRTHYGPRHPSRYGGTAKYEPGPAFTVNVHNAGEWFAARRKNYYAVTFNGSLAPMWLNYYFASRLGFGGGGLCHITIPQHGKPVIAGTLNYPYGKKNQPHKWRTFHIHSVVGELADGRPLISGDSIHHNARLEDNVVTSSGEIRDRPLRIQRRTTFNDDDIECELELRDTDFRTAYWRQGQPNTIAVAYEMIPYVSTKALPATVTVIAGNTNEPVPMEGRVEGARNVIVSRGEFGATITFDDPVTVELGENDAVLVVLTEKPVTLSEHEGQVVRMGLKYRIKPWSKSASAPE